MIIVGFLYDKNEVMEVQRIINCWNVAKRFRMLGRKSFLNGCIPLAQRGKKKCQKEVE